jgi:tetratricopeptide (TPR) repeat protein
MRVQNGWWLGAMLLAALAAGRLAAQTPAPDGKNPPAPAASAPAPKEYIPFPEDDSKTNEIPEAHTPAAPATAPDAPAPRSGTPAAPGGDAGGYSSSGDGAAGDPGAGTMPDTSTRKKLELHDEGSAGHIDTARADNDEVVADFYEKNGNYEGAYLRYKDAVTFNPDDPEAHYLMAEMARKTGKNADAIAQFNAGLKLDPKNKRAKEAQKALTELQASAAKK